MCFSFCETRQKFLKSKGKGGERKTGWEEEEEYVYNIHECTEVDVSSNEHEQ